MAEWGECSMKGINPSPAEVQNVPLADGAFMWCMQIDFHRSHKLSAELFSSAPHTADVKLPMVIVRVHEWLWLVCHDVLFSLVSLSPGTRSV